MGDFPYLFSVETLTLGRLFPSVWFLKKKKNTAEVELISHLEDTMILCQFENITLDSTYKRKQTILKSKFQCQLKKGRKS